jgi:hypothetical protein
MTDSKYRSREHYITTAVASTIAGVMSKFIIYPVESIKTKVQVQII